MDKNHYDILVKFLDLTQQDLDQLSQTLKEVDSARLFNKIIKSCLIPNHSSVFWGDRLLTLDKSMGFFSETAFRESYDAIVGSHQYDQYQGPHSIAWRLHTLVWAANIGISLEGDFVECGVFKGDMAWFVSNLVDLASVNKKFYLYDTFDGFSPKYSSSSDFPDIPNFINYANQFYQNPFLYGDVCQRFIERPYVKVLKGVVPDILLENAPEKISFLHIDLNSPAAEIGALEILFPRVTRGGVVVFDDYGWKVFRKQKEAEDIFMRNIGHEILELPTGQGIVVKL